MTFPVPIHPAAYRELEAAVEWYEGKDPGLGGEFYEAVIQAVTFGVPLPVLGIRRPVSDATVQRILVDRFPYTIFQATRPGQERRVLAVAHQKRRPGYWLARLRPATRRRWVQRRRRL